MTPSEISATVQRYLNRPPLTDEERLLILKDFEARFCDSIIELPPEINQAIADNIEELLL